MKAFDMCSGPRRAEKITLRNDSFQIIRMMQCKLVNTETGQLMPCSVEILLLRFNMTEMLE
jgi:hypothetical protein